MSVFDEVITLASLGSGPIFEPIQAAFIEGVTTHFRECHADLTEVSQMCSLSICGAITHVWFLNTCTSVSRVGSIIITLFQYIAMTVFKQSVL